MLFNYWSLLYSHALFETCIILQMAKLNQQISKNNRHYLKLLVFVHINHLKRG